MYILVPDMGLGEKFSHKNEISTMTHTFLLIFFYPLQRINLILWEF